MPESTYCFSPNPGEHDFDWVRARGRCSIEQEFPKLKEAMRACFEDGRLIGHQLDFEFEFSEREDVEVFGVGRKIQARAAFHNPFSQESIYDRAVRFRLERANVGGRSNVAQRINVEWFILGDREGFRPLFQLTVKLCKSGLCRYQISDAGEYLRWQVVMRAVEALL